MHLLSDGPIIKMDKITTDILKFIKSSKEPLETRDIEKKLKITRAIAITRLNRLWGEGKIRGKTIGPGRKAFIWWKKDAFK